MAKKCPLSSLQGKDGKYARKVRIGDKCVNPTSANKRGAHEWQRKQDVLRQNKKRGPVATAIAAEKEREKARKLGVQV